MTNINKISVGRITAFSLLAVTLVVAVTLATAPLAKAGDVECDDEIFGTIDNNVEVTGGCKLSTDEIDGNVKIEGDDDFWVNFDTGTLNGNIECKEAGEDSITGFAVAVGSGTEMNGNVKAEDCGLVIIGAATIEGNVEVKDGDLEILSGAVIEGNVKVEDGDCDIAVSATIEGNLEGECE